MTARLRAALEELRAARLRIGSYNTHDPHCGCSRCELDRAIDAVLAAAEAEEREG